jgi:phage regulator Rha-like protein
MKLLESMDNKETMGSLEIAELTNKQHSDVLKDIKRILEECNIHSEDFLFAYKGNNGQNYRCYKLPKRECDLVVSGYSAKYRLAIIDRWHELELANNKPMSQLEMLSEGFKQMALVEKKQIAIETRQDKQGSLLIDLSAKTKELDNKIATAKSREVIPPKGYCSVKSLEITFASVFPKTHIRGLLSSSFALPLVNTKTATRWVEGTSEWSDYVVYNMANVGLVINAIVSSGIRVNGSTGKPTQKVKSPLYGQPFKHPM